MPGYLEAGLLYLMAENSLYFEHIVAARSVLLDEETALAGDATISLETQGDCAESDVLTYVENNFVEFLRLLRYLRKDDQDLLLSYYALGKTQEILAIAMRTTQTLCSARLRATMEQVGSLIVLGPPTVEVLSPILEREGLEHQLAVPLSQAIALYAETRSFQRVAEVLGLNRAAVRRVMIDAGKKLQESKDLRTTVVGAYIAGLVEKASASGRGFTARERGKQGDVFVRTPSVLGEFRIDVGNAPGFEQVFTTRAAY